jgi:putative cell wall-binding protein
MTLGGIAVVGAGTASAATTGTTYGAMNAPYISAGANNQGAGNWLLRVPNTFVAGDTLTIHVADNQVGTTTNCTVANEFLGFATQPSASSTAEASDNAADTVPQIVTAITSAPGESQCSAQHVNDLLTLTFANTATGASGDYFDVVVSNVAYIVGAAAHTGNVAVNFNGTGWNTQSGDNSTLTQATFATLDSKMSNAIIQTVAVSANSPAVALAPSSTNASISNIVVTEAVPGAVPTGYVCLKLSGGTFNSSSTPVVTPSGGGATAANPGYVTVGGSQNTVEFNVTKQSSGTPASFTVSGLGVNAPAAAAPVTLTATDGASADCTTTPGTSITPQAVRAFDVLNSSRIQGSDADATAIAETEAAYTCATINHAANGAGGAAATVILATDSAPYDALAASFMAGQMGTGILLTPPNALSAETQAALRQLGVSNVVVVGGPLAVSDTVLNQVKALQATNCAGTPQVTGTGAAQTIQATRVYGQTALDTAADIAQYFGSGAVRSAAFPGAYGSAYNDTTGTASTSGPVAAAPTAVVATDNGFADAVSGSALAYNNPGGGVNKEFPVLLTDASSLSTQAAGAITNMGITQVILLGGPQAISNNVVTQLQAMGVSVLRIAGQDLTDTSQMLALFELNSTNSSGKVDGLDWLATYGQTLYVARGDYYTDGLAGGVVAGKAGAPLVLSFDPNTVGRYLTTFLNTAGSTGSTYPITNVIVLGGIQAITPTTLANLLSAISAG